MSTQTKEREPFLDILRGGAAVSIILYHYTNRFDQMIGHTGTWKINLPWGWMAWAVFFVMTGYLVYPKTQNICRFVKGKMVRLYPGYWAAMCVSFLVTSVYLKEFSTSFRDFVIDLSMLGNYLGAKSVVGVDWTLSVDLVFYAIIAVVIVLKGTKNYSEARIITIWSVVSCIIMLLKYIGVDNSILKVARIIFAAQYAHLFFAGHMLRRIKEDNGNRRINLVCIIFSVIAHWIAFRSISFEVFYCVVIAVFLCFTLDVRIDIPDKILGFIEPIGTGLAWIAGISYPLYLVHEYLGFAILKYFDSIGMTSEVLIVVPIFVSVLVAAIIHKYIECPATQICKK